MRVESILLAFMYLTSPNFLIMTSTQITMTTESYQADNSCSVPTHTHLHHLLLWQMCNTVQSKCRRTWRFEICTLQHLDVTVFLKTTFHGTRHQNNG